MACPPVVNHTGFLCWHTLVPTHVFPSPLPFGALHAQAGDRDGACVAAHQPHFRTQGLTLPPLVVCHAWCCQAVPANALEWLNSHPCFRGQTVRTISTPFCGFWVIWPIWDNNSHYALWSFLIKMTFPLSLKVEISA